MHIGDVKGTTGTPRQIPSEVTPRAEFVQFLPGVGSVRVYETKIFIHYYI